MTRVALKRLGHAVEDRRAVEDNPRGTSVREMHLAAEVSRLRAKVRELEQKLGELPVLEVR
jgi:hypothetical protein